MKQPPLKSRIALYRKLTLLILILPLYIQARGQNPKFEHLSLEKGVSHNLTHCIFEDSKGFMWFGTMFGLIKYDGKKYTEYRHDSFDTTSISFDNIISIYEDRLGDLWIGTWGGGLNKFDRDKETFTRFIHDPGDSNSLSNNIINSIYEDHFGALWVGTDNGLNKLILNNLTGDKNNRKANYKFIHYDHDLRNIKSLSNNTINTIFEDKSGTLWIGTNNGLNKYDRQKEIFLRYFNFNPEYTIAYHPNIFKLIDSFSNSKKNLASILQAGDFQDISKDFTITQKSNLLVVCLGEGRVEYLGEEIGELFDLGWIETTKGNNTIWKMNFNGAYYAGGAMKNRIKIDLLTLNPGKYRLRYISDDSHSYNSWNNHHPNRPKDWGIQLFIITKKDKAAIQANLARMVSLNPNSISNNRITSICEGENENLLWIGTMGGGLNKFDTEKEHFIYYRNSINNPNSLVNDYVNTIHRDQSGTLWAGTRMGISKFDDTTGGFTNYTHDPLDPNSLGGSNVYAICKDRSGIVWFGTFGCGIDKLDLKKNKFTHIKRKISITKNIGENNIRSIQEDKDGILWIGTRGGGLIKYDKKDNSFTYFLYDGKNSNSLSSNYIQTLFKEKEGNLWIGTLFRGLNKLEAASNKVTRYFYNNKDPNSLTSNNILSIIKDSRGFLWIGTNGGGLNRLRKDGKQFDRYFNDPSDSNCVSNNYIYSLYEDYAGNLWIGTLGGLNKLNRDRTRFTHYKHNPNNSNSLCNDYVYAIYESHNKRDSCLWIGTAGGLNKFDLKTEKFTRFTKRDGVPNQVICGILEDDSGFLWLSTHKGLSKFNPRSGDFENYDLADGLQSNMFNIGACQKLKSGELVFGGINGFNIFHPDQIISNSYIPPVFITGFKKFNKTMNFDKAISDIKEIELAYKDNFFTIEFAALDYTHPEKNKYAYKLEGVDDDWIYIGNKNFASYTNVDPGTYTFRVKGSNSDGIWNEKGTSVKVIITPPFWLSWWFKTLMVFMILFIFVSIIYLIMKKEKRKTALNKKISELKLQALRTQMDPHFIFNTINSIQYFITCNDQESAFTYLIKFSKLLRITLDNAEKLTIPLIEEIEALRLYLELQLLRFEDKFEYNIEVDPSIDIYNVEIPIMIIQPYIENAIKHGLNNNSNKGKLKIYLNSNDNNKIVCTIQDNGIGIVKALELKKINGSTHKSSGMKLIKERLKIMNAAHKNDINVSVVDLNQADEALNGTKVTIQIPV